MSNHTGVSKAIAFSVALIGIAVFYYFVIFLPKQKQDELDFQKQAQEQQQKQEQAKLDLQQQVQEAQQKTDFGVVLINYKIDAQNVSKHLLDLLSWSMENTPEFQCPYIVDARTTKLHTYYMTSGEIDLLSQHYGKYRKSIPYINTDLDSMYSQIQMVKDKCEAAGYKI